MDKVALVRLIRPTYGMDEGSRETIRGLAVYAGGTRKAVKLLNQALKIRKNGYDEETERELVWKLAAEHAHKPNFGERFLGCNHSEFIRKAAEYLLKAEVPKQ